MNIKTVFHSATGFFLALGIQGLAHGYGSTTDGFLCRSIGHFQVGNSSQIPIYGQAFAQTPAQSAEASLKNCQASAGDDCQIADCYATFVTNAEPAPVCRVTGTYQIGNSTPFTVYFRSSDALKICQSFAQGCTTLSCTN